MFYEDMSQNERLGAAKVAQELLRTVPAAQKPLKADPCFFCNPKMLSELLSILVTAIVGRVMS
jgi:hypothetical protein